MSCGVLALQPQLLDMKGFLECKDDSKQREQLLFRIMLLFKARLLLVCSLIWHCNSCPTNFNIIKTTVDSRGYTQRGVVPRKLLKCVIMSNCMLLREVF